MSPPEAGELGHLVRDARPRPREAFTAALDARVDAGFPRQRRLPSLPRPRVLYPALGIAATLIAAVILATTLIGGSATSPGDLPSARHALVEPAPAPTPQTESVAPPSGRDAAGTPARKVERSAMLALATGAGDLDHVADGVVRTTDAAGGFVASSQVDSGTAGGTARFDLRVPADRLDAALSALSRLGHVRSRSQSTDDVTGAVVSARQRLTDGQAQRQALLRALGRARTATQAEAIHARLRLARAEIASARGDLHALGQRTAFSSVAVTVSAHGDSAASGGGGFGPADAARDAVRILGAIAGGLLVALAVLLPVAALVAALWFAGRAVRRRSRERALDAV
jgi:Domain of unknown function (DUF4349)